MDEGYTPCEWDDCTTLVSTESSTWPFCKDEHVTLRPRQQVGGNHYTRHTIQQIDVIADYELDFVAGNVVKYVMRYQDKDGVNDLRKARHFLNMLIAREEGDPKWASTPP